MTGRPEPTPFTDDECEWIRVPTYEAVKARYERGERRPTRAMVGGGTRYMQTMSHWDRARRESCNHPPELRTYRLSVINTEIPECGRCGASLSGLVGGSHP